MKERVGSFLKYLNPSGQRVWRYQFNADPVDGSAAKLVQAALKHATQQ